MIKVEKTEVFGWEHACRGMRNPLNSWSKSDSMTCVVDCDECEVDMDVDCGHFAEREYNKFFIGKNDLVLMKKLCKAGTDHRKFMRMITVYMDITAPLYWWSEYDTYKVGTVANSCSKMHKLHDKELTIDDFSHDHLLDDWNAEGGYDGVHTASDYLGGSCRYAEFLSYQVPRNKGQEILVADDTVASFEL